MMRSALVMTALATLSLAACSGGGLFGTSSTAYDYGNEEGHDPQNQAVNNANSSPSPTAAGGTSVTTTPETPSATTPLTGPSQTVDLGSGSSSSPATPSTTTTTNGTISNPGGIGSGVGGTRTKEGRVGGTP